MKITAIIIAFLLGATLWPETGWSKAATSTTVQAQPAARQNKTSGASQGSASSLSPTTAQQNRLQKKCERNFRRQKYPQSAHTSFMASCMKIANSRERTPQATQSQPPGGTAKN